MKKINLNVAKWVELNKELNPKALMLYVYFLSLDKPFRLNKTFVCKTFELNGNTWYTSINQLKDKGYLKEVAKDEYTIDNDLFESNCAREKSISCTIETLEDIWEEALQELKKEYNESLTYMNNRFTQILVKTTLNVLDKVYGGD